MGQLLAQEEKAKAKKKKQAKNSKKNQKQKAHLENLKVAGVDDESEEETPVVTKVATKEPLLQAAKPTEFEKETPKKKRNRSVKKDRPVHTKSAEKVRKAGKSVEKKVAAPAEETAAPVVEEPKKAAPVKADLSRKERKKLEYIEKIKNEKKRKLTEGDNEENPLESSKPVELPYGVTKEMLLKTTTDKKLKKQLREEIEAERREEEAKKIAARERTERMKKEREERVLAKKREAEEKVRSAEEEKRRIKKEAADKKKEERKRI